MQQSRSIDLEKLNSEVPVLIDVMEDMGPRLSGPDVPTVIEWLYYPKNQIYVGMTRIGEEMVGNPLAIQASADKIKGDPKGETFDIPDCDLQEMSRLTNEELAPRISLALQSMWGDDILGHLMQFDPSYPVKSPDFTQILGRNFDGSLAPEGEDEQGTASGSYEGVDETYVPSDEVDPDSIIYSFAHYSPSQERLHISVYTNGTLMQTQIQASQELVLQGAMAGQDDVPEADYAALENIASTFQYLALVKSSITRDTLTPYVSIKDCTLDEAMQKISYAGRTCETDLPKVNKKQKLTLH